MTNCRKIAFYIPLLNVGGAEKVLINSINAFSKSNCKEIYLFTDTSNSDWLLHLDSQINLINISSTRNILNRLIHISQIIEQYQIEVFISHLTHSNIHALIIKLVYKFKLIIVEHSITSKYLDDLGFKGVILKLLFKNLLNKADKIITVSKATRHDLKVNFKANAELCSVIYNPIDFNRIKLDSNEAMDKSILGKINNRKYIVTVSRLEVLKNHVSLIEDLKQFLISNNYVLLVVGGGSQFNNIFRTIVKNKLENHVFITGYLNNPYPYILNSSLLVHPSKYEGFGLVLIEAIFLNIPVISMNFEAAYEALEEGKIGNIATDTESLLTLINDVMIGTDLSPSKLLGYSNFVKNKYNLINMINDYKSIINEIII